MSKWQERPAIISHDKQVSYGMLLNGVSCWKNQLDTFGLQHGQVVAVASDYSPAVVALLIALIDHRAIVVPLSTAASLLSKEFLDIAEVQTIFSFDAADRPQIDFYNVVVKNRLSRSLIELGDPGLILFSSGSTGKPKGILHNMTRFLMKFDSPRAPFRTVALPPIDHVAGLDTLFYSLSSGGTLVCPSDRSPNAVCQTIERYQVELLPATATFLNLLAISGVYEQFDLSSLRLVAYGSEVMPECSLARLKEILPRCRFVQKYGMTELGSPRTRSKEDGSLWVRIDCDGVETKVVDGVLWIRTQSAMMGYLNAPSPFDEEGWMNTEDMVETDGDYIRILGRRTDIINVGGQKVYPAEVENVLTQMDNVRDATVYAEKNPITGNIVGVRVSLVAPEDLRELKKRIRSFCRGKLAPYKMPVKVEIHEQQDFGARYKKMRRPAAEHGSG